MIVCAEIGINWDGDHKKLLKMIKDAAGAGAGAVKIQYIKPSRMYSDKAVYELPEGKKPIKDYLKKYQLNIPDVKRIYRLTKELNVSLIVTVCDVASVVQLAPFIDAFKVASSELNFHQLHVEINKTQKPCIVSTGGASFKEMEDVRRLYNNSELIMLHCNYSYPAHLDDVNLSKLKELKKICDRVGFSNHTNDIQFIPVMCGAIGCCYYETHVTFEKKKEGDHHFSLEIPELKQLCENVKKGAIIFGNEKAELTEKEKLQRNFGYRKAFAKNNIRKDGRIRPQDIIWLRNGDYENTKGFDPKDEYLIINKISKVDIKRGEKILKEDLF